MHAVSLASASSWCTDCVPSSLAAGALHRISPCTSYQCPLSYPGTYAQPDFDAVALPPCRILRVRRAAFRAALEATSLDPVLGYQVRLIWRPCPPSLAAPPCSGAPCVCQTGCRQHGTWLCQPVLEGVWQ